MVMATYNHTPIPVTHRLARPSQGFREAHQHLRPKAVIKLTARFAFFVNLLASVAK
jgi:hypothetical protein